MLGSQYKDMCMTLLFMIVLIALDWNVSLVDGEVHLIIPSCSGKNIFKNKNYRCANNPLIKYPQF